ncbi:MAG: M48 family metallopeptidase [Thermodesulfobacteriota bacterium]
MINSGNERKKFCNLPLLFAFFSFFLLIYSCATAPITGRNQLILVSQEQELQMGTVAYDEVVKKEKVSKDPNYNSAVKRVANRVARVANRPDFEWEYTVIDNDKVINAFALPGGKIGVYTGILKVAQTDAGLATVLSHEVGHATARHGGERVSAGLLAQLGAVGLSAALGGSSVDPQVTNGIMQAYGVGVGVGAILPFSRTQESEADRIGLIYMARSGYDPRESVKFWQRMAAATKGQQRPPEFLSTHPDNGTRIANLQRHMPEALAVYQNSQKAPNYQIVK